MHTFFGTLRQIGALTLALFLALVANFAYGQWNAPTSAPTGNNTPAPINVSASNQVKQGALDVNYLGVSHNTPAILLNETDEGLASRGLLNYYTNTAGDRVLALSHRDQPASSWRYGLQLVAQNPTDPASYFARFQNQVRANEFCAKDGSNCFSPSAVTSSGGGAPSGPTIYECPSVSRMPACSGQLQRGSTCSGPRQDTGDDSNFSDETRDCTAIGRLY